MMKEESSTRLADSKVSGDIHMSGGMLYTHASPVAKVKPANTPAPPTPVSPSSELSPRQVCCCRVFYYVTFCYSS